LLTAEDREHLTGELIENIDDASALLKAIANEKRIVILCHLMEGEKSVSELETMLDLSQSALSQHLARLRAVKVVKTRRAAQTIYYSLNGEGAQTILEALHALFNEPVQAIGIDPIHYPAA